MTRSDIHVCDGDHALCINLYMKKYGSLIWIRTLSISEIFQEIHHLRLDGLDL